MIVVVEAVTGVGEGGTGVAGGGEGELWDDTGYGVAPVSLQLSLELSNVVPSAWALSLEPAKVAPASLELVKAVP